MQYQQMCNLLLNGSNDTTSRWISWMWIRINDHSNGTCTRENLSLQIIY